MLVLIRTVSNPAGRLSKTRGIKTPCNSLNLCYEKTPSVKCISRKTFLQ